MKENPIHSLWGDVRHYVRGWFQKLAPREQIYLLCGGAAVLLYLLLALLWWPLAQAQDEMAQRNEQLTQQLARVRLLAAELRQGGAEGGPEGGRQLNQLINRAASQFDIRPSRIQPNARGEVQVRFDEVGFADFMGWLHHIELREGARLRELSINQGSRSGTVQATVRLGQWQGQWQGQ